MRTKNLRRRLKNAHDEENLVMEEEIMKIDNELNKEVGRENAEKVMHNFKLLARTDGSVNVNGIWKVKKKLFPKHNHDFPAMKQNHEGKMISSKQGLLDLYESTFIHRLRQRPIRKEYQEIFEMKIKLCHQRLKLSSLNKSEEWTEEQFLKILKSLKDNKSRDPHGLVNEIFKPSNIGLDLFH